MKCENDFCIYNDQEMCMLNFISLDTIGMCLDCITIDIDNEILKQAKTKLLGQFEKYDL